MNIFKPTKAKLILWIVFLSATIVIPKTSCSQGLADQPTCAPVSGIGYPIFIGEQLQGDVIMPLSFDLGNFILNLVIYYVLASLVALVWTRRGD